MKMMNDHPTTEQTTNHGKRWIWSLLIFFLILFLVNLAQALWTEVMNDEAYYALFGEQLAWGYFDHPPMVALMTYYSNLLFDGNLSIRFFTILFQLATLYVIWRLIDEKAVDGRRVSLFVLIASSMAMLSAYGFVTAPDVPLLLFSSLFLLFYKRFLYEERWGDALLIALTVVGMCYSKYHALLIVGLVILSNPQLLRKPKVWVAMGITLLLLIPHLLWQIEHGFPSVNYHLIARSHPFLWSYLFEYFPNQLLVFNPISLLLVFYFIFSQKPRDHFERALYFLIAGILIFFGLMSFRGHVEPHWTVVATIPMIYLLYDRATQSKKIEKLLFRWMPVVICLILITRAALIIDVLPETLMFYGKEQRSKALAEIAGSRTVVFTGSFQEASCYAYFTKKEAVLLSGIDSRMTQFDLWQREIGLHRKKVFISVPNHPKAKVFRVNESLMRGFECNNFQSVNRIEINYEDPPKMLHVGELFEIEMEMFNPYPYTIDFNHTELPVTLEVAFCQDDQITMSRVEMLYPIDVIYSRQRLQCLVGVVVPDLLPGKYQMTFTLHNKLCPAINAPFVTVHVVKG